MYTNPMCILNILLSKPSINVSLDIKVHLISKPNVAKPGTRKLLFVSFMRFHENCEVMSELPVILREKLDCSNSMEILCFVCLKKK